MALKHRLLSLTYGPLSAARVITRMIHAGARGRLRVLLFHDIPLADRAAFKAQLTWLSRRWQFVDADRFAEMLNGTSPIVGDNLLLTFDDGLSSNFEVAQEILNPMGIRALFFIVSSFAELSTVAAQRRFIVERLYPSSSGEKLPADLQQIRTMSHDHLRTLIRDGHTIGAHTATHARLSELRELSALEREIIGSADHLSVALGVRIEHFAFGFGNLHSFSAAAMQVARQRFPFIYTGMRGDNAAGATPWAIRRDTLSPRDSHWLIGALTEGAADRRYRSSLATLDKWGVEAPSTVVPLV